MPLPLNSAFSRRPETDGAIVFTCNTCFVAVALSLPDDEMEKAEREHACNPETLNHWRMFLDEIERCNRRREQGQSI